MRSAALACLFFISACSGIGRDRGNLDGKPGDDGTGDGSGGIDGLPALSIPAIADPQKGGTRLTVPYTISGATRPMRSAALVLESVRVDGDLTGGSVGFDLPLVDKTAHVTLEVTMDDTGEVVSVDSNTFAIDSSAPALSLTGPPRYVAGGTFATIAWVSSDAHTEQNSATLQWSDDGVTWQDIATGLPDTGMYTWSVPSTVSPTARVRVVVRDRLGQEGTATTGVFTIDSTVPVHPGLMRINGSATPMQTINRIALVDLDAGPDDATPIVAYCLKRTLGGSLGTPAADDPCWIKLESLVPKVAPALTLHLTEVPFSLGFLPGAVKVFAWVKDALGRISQNDASIGNDRVDIAFDPGIPPAVSEVFATTTDTPSTPPSDAQLTVGTANDYLYVKWYAQAEAGKPEALPLKVSISYTSDDVTYTSVATDLANADGANCAIDGSKTGCYRWEKGTIPLSPQYLRVRVTVTDQRGLATVRSTTPPLNVANKIGFLVGNTEPGFGGNARATVFNNGQKQSNYYYDEGSLQVSARGIVYFRDRTYGVMWVDPKTGNVNPLLRRNEAQHDDDTTPIPIASATVEDAARIKLDYKDRLFVWDKTRLRRVNVNADGEPESIQTIVPDAFLCRYPYQCDFAVLKNDDIYMPTGEYGKPAQGWGWRIIHGGDVANTEIVHPNGLGYSANPSVDLTGCWLHSPTFFYTENDVSVLTHNLSIGGVEPNNCAAAYGFFHFNGATGASQAPFIDVPGADNGGWMRVAGMDGRLYAAVWNGAVGMFRWEPDSNTWTRIVGKAGVTGQNCSIVTPVQGDQCETELQDFFVDGAGVPYWTAAGKIRTLDDSKNVVDLIGEGFYNADNTDALNARVPFAHAFGHWNDGSNDRIVVADIVNVRYREAVIGGAIKTIAGNGVSASIAEGADPTTLSVPLSSGSSFALGPDGTLYPNMSGFKLWKLPRTVSATWQVLVPDTGTVPYQTAPEGTAASDIKFSYRTISAPPADAGTVFGYYDHVFGVQGGLVYRFLGGFNQGPAVYWDGLIFGWDVTTGTLSKKVAGTDTRASNTLCASGSPSLTCNLPVSIYIAPGNQAFDATNNRWLTRKSWVSTIRTIRAFTIGGNVQDLLDLPKDFLSFTYRSDTDALYVCDIDGELSKVPIATGVPEAITLPVPGMRCTGNQLLYLSSRNALIFPYELFGLQGIAEVKNPG